MNKLQSLLQVFAMLIYTNSEVFNLCYAVDPTEIPSLGGGPHGPKVRGPQVENPCTN